MSAEDQAILEKISQLAGMTAHAAPFSLSTLVLIHS
jgi:hypothetical protein